MSAICGLINFDGAPVDQALMRKMAEASDYHGPDGIRYWIEGNVGLAHLAFNTTPESQRERQPLSSYDGSLYLVADARVDNRPELISRLTDKGYGVNPESTDADLILAAYQHWGEDCPLHIIGDFAFALWDKRKHQFFCAQDIFGIRPLVYSNTGNVFCFATEAQQLLQHPKIPCRLDNVAIADFLAATIIEQSRTFFSDISLLPAGHSLTISASEQVALKRYWDVDPTDEVRYSNNEEYVSHFRELFERAVSDRLRSSVPVIGIELSGGLDSSSVAAAAQHSLRKFREANLNAKGRLKAFTLIFEEIKSEDERYNSKLVADALSIETTYVANDNIAFISDIENPDLESPYRAWESTENKILDHVRSQGGQVVLTGIGGDDLLTGSALIYADQIRRGKFAAVRDLRQDAIRNDKSFSTILYKWFVKPRVPKVFWRTLNKVRQQSPPRLYPTWIHADFAAQAQLQQRLKNEPHPKIWSWAKQANYQTASNLGNYHRQHLQWLARLGVRQGIEHRHPFLDRRLFEFVLRLPPEQLWRDGFSKFILREAMVGYLPQPILKRHGKTTYADVAHHCFKVKEVGIISQLLENPLTAKLGFIDKEELNRVFQAYLSDKTKQNITFTLMRLVSLEVWLYYYRELFYPFKER